MFSLIVDSRQTLSDFQYPKITPPFFLYFDINMNYESNQRCTVYGDDVSNKPDLLGRDLQDDDCHGKRWGIFLMMADYWSDVGDVETTVI